MPSGAEVIPKRHSQAVKEAVSGSGGGGITININHPVVREEQDIHKIARAVSMEIASSSRSRVRSAGLTLNHGAAY
jgi:hypothetical protein